MELVIGDFKVGIMSLRTKCQKLNRAYLRMYLLYLESTVQGNLAAAAQMDSMDSLNRLNPVDDNNKLETVNLTSS